MYRIYGNSKTGYKEIDRVQTIEEVYDTLDPIVSEKQYNKYLVIKRENQTDETIGLFYTEKDYMEFKQETSNQKTLVKRI